MLYNKVLAVITRSNPKITYVRKPAKQRSVRKEGMENADRSIGPVGPTGLSVGAFL
jgi:hypothetical protein